MVSPPIVDTRWELVQRVAGSPFFHRSPRMRELLLYICERALHNRAEDLREALIGQNVFGRKPDYSPGDDNIVRVEVRHLRKRLEEYFASEGSQEPILITIPKGTEITAYVNGDVQLDRAKFEAAPAQAAAAPSSTTPPTASQEQSTGAQVEVSSTPDAADIEIDGKFVGSTPSSVGVTPGEHDLVVKKSGFKPWEKKIAVSSGHVKIDAQLEAESK